MYDWCSEEENFKNFVVQINTDANDTMFDSFFNYIIMYYYLIVITILLKFVLLDFVID